MNLDALRTCHFDGGVQDYGPRDSILYALGLGYGADPTDPAQLQFVYEQGLKAVPSMVNVLAHPGMWVKRPDLGLDWTRLLHGEQRFEIVRPLAAEGRVTGRYSVTAVVDLGPERGARLNFRKDLHDAGGELLAVVRSTYLLRGDGGSGGFGTPDPALDALPDRAPDHVVDLQSLPQQALIYRLSGDWNPLHADPVVARRAGFDRPILHGLCSMGLATRAVVGAVAPGAPERLRGMSLRFSRPVMPGDRITVRIFDLGGGQYGFRALVPARDQVVLDRGRAWFGD